MDIPERFLAEWQHGCEDFDAGRYWHAHEAWEAMWLGLRSEGDPMNEPVRGLIQIAAMLFQHERGRDRGIVNLWNKALPRLEGWGSNIGYVDLSVLIDELRPIHEAAVEGRIVPVIRWPYTLPKMHSGTSTSKDPL